MSQTKDNQTQSSRTPIVWSIAGSDPSGGAGLQTDMRVFEAMGVHGCAVVAALTAQNTAHVTGWENIVPAFFHAQIDALCHDLPPAAVKIGMLGNAATVQETASVLKTINTPVILDPIILSSSGTPLLDETALIVLRDTLLPMVAAVTPNIAEAAWLTKISISTAADVEKAASQLLEMGTKATFITGFDSGNDVVQDYFTDGSRSFWLTLPKWQGDVPRGTGCALSSALAAALAQGYAMPDAAVMAKAYVHRCIRTAGKLGSGKPLARHAPWPAAPEDMPWLTHHAEAGLHRPLFPTCGDTPLGFYPIVDSLDWLRRLLLLGVTTAQLRIKNKTGEILEKEIADAIALGKRHNCRLFINDYWELAVKHGAYGVHLGQEDLEAADISALEQSGVRLGLSTHSYEEIARAHALRPSYIAIGPIFPTTLKAMRFAPQGVQAFATWRQMLDYPLVAIGGIKLEQAHKLIMAGADSIAVVSDITQNTAPEARVGEWLNLQFAEM